MASSEDQRSQCKAETTAHPPANNTPPPSMGYLQGDYPLTMGYPSSHHHPPYAYGYARDPPAAYCTNPPIQVERPNAAFVRGVVAALILLAFFVCLSSIVTWLILRPNNPIVKLETFSFTGLNLAKTNHSGAWAANLTFENPNPKLIIIFDRIECFIDYSESALAISFLDPFSLNVKGTRKIQVNLTAENSDQPEGWNEAAGKMAGERAAGAMSFNLRFIAWVTLKSGSWWTKHGIMRIFCENLKVGFSGINATNGVLLPNKKPKQCLVHL